MGMSVKVIIHPLLQHLARHKSTVDVSGDTVGSCLEQLVKWFPDLKDRLLDDKGNLRGQVNVFINGVSLFPEKLDKAVQDGDELLLITAVGGG